MPIQEVHRDISKGHQTSHAVFVYSCGEQRVRLSIKSDSVEFQSHAKAEAWSLTDNRWNYLTSIPYSQMRTKHGLAYAAWWAAADNYEADRVKLLAQVKAILPGWDR